MNKTLHPESLMTIVAKTGLGIIILLFLMASYHFQHATVDDLYISLRYAYNLATGHGLVFNLGERVEGFSNFLWVLLLAIGAFFRARLPLLSKLLSVLFGAGTISLFWLMVKNELRPSSSATLVTAFATAFFFSMSYAFVFWSASGMETSLYAFLILLSLLTQLKDIESKSTWTVSGAVFILLALCRVEGIVFYGFSLLPKWLSLRKNPDLLLSRKLLKEGVLVLSAFFVALLIRHAYYGQWISNTYYAKLGGSPWHVGMAYFLSFARHYYGLMIMGTIGLILMRGPLAYLRNLIAAYLVGYTALIIFIGGDWMWYFRFFVPLLALLWLAVAHLFLKSWDWLNQSFVKNAYARIGMILLLMVIFLFPMRHTFIGSSDLKGLLQLQVKKPAFNIEALIIKTHREIAQYLTEHAPAGSVIAANHIGALGYYSNFTIIDMVGLTNPTVAKLNKRFHEKNDPQAILARHPDYVILTTRTKPEKDKFVADYWVGETALYHLPQFKQQYEAWGRYWEYTFDGKSEYVVVFRRKSEPAADGMK